MAKSPEKLKALPPAWEALHERSARAMLRAEVKTLRAMQATLNRAVAETIAEMAVHSDLNERMVIRAIRRAVSTLSVLLERDITIGRARARGEAVLQLTHELDQVRRELKAADVAEDEHPEDPDQSEGEQDQLHAHAAAISLASQWGQIALAVTRTWVNAPDEKKPNIGQAIQKTQQIAKPRLERTAATEVSHAFNDEKDEGIGWVAEKHESAGWIGALFEVWNGKNDLKQCADCRQHNGEYVLAGTSFSDGDEPGFVHLRCRCDSSFALLPWHLTNAIPGHYTPDDFDEEDDENVA